MAGEFGPTARHRVSGGHGLAHVAPAVRIVAAVVAVACFALLGYGWYNFHSLDSGLQRVHLSNLGAAAPSLGSTQSAAPAQQTPGTAQNILIVGLDSRAGLSPAEVHLLKLGEDISLSTDTMMVVHVPSDGSKATMISLPRDAYVDIPGYLKNKLNAAYADAYSYTPGTVAQKNAAGENELVATVSKLTGLTINHYVQVGFGGFYTIAKAIGPIPVDLCAATDDTVAHNAAEGQNGGSGFVMSAGKHMLNAVQAMEFVRQRHNLHGGDLAREKRQRYFLGAAFRRIASAGVLLNPSKLHNLIKAITGTFTVDDGFSLQQLATQMTALNANNITGHTIPTQGAQTVSIAGSQQDVLIVDPAKVRAYVSEVLATASSASSATHSAAPSSSAHSSAPASTGTHKPSTKPADAGCIY